MIKGKGAYSRLKYESGVHRVQRVPVTESSGRIHTSTVTVAVLAEVEEVDIQIPERISGWMFTVRPAPVVKTCKRTPPPCALPIFPPGIVVACQDERSQLQNRLRAMSILRARLYEMEKQKRQQELEAAAAHRWAPVNAPKKSAPITIPQSRVTDHRINVSVFNINAVLDGESGYFH